MEAVDRFRFGRWDSYQYLYYKMEGEAEAEAVEVALKSASRSLVKSVSNNGKSNAISLTTTLPLQMEASISQLTKDESLASFQLCL